MFKPLTKDNISGIVDLMMKSLNERLADRQLSIVLTGAAKQFIIDHGYDPVYGARPLRRYLQSTVENIAARIILGGEIHEGTTIVIDVKNGKLEGSLAQTVNAQ